MLPEAVGRSDPNLHDAAIREDDNKGASRSFAGRDILSEQHLLR